MLRAGLERQQMILCTHYACENFYEVKDRPAAVSCLSVTHLSDDDTVLYSPVGFPTDKSSEEREVEILRRYYSYLAKRPDALVIHWNMNAAHYGFAALAARYRFLTDEDPSYQPVGDRTFDLDAIITRRYGDDYAKHPKLRNLALLNDFNMRYFLSGKDEAEKRKVGDYGAIDRSTSEKTRIIANLFRRLAQGTLRTLHSVGAVEFAASHLDAVRIVLRLGDRFREVERSLKRRYADREPLTIVDEYDAQYVVRALLKLFFDDLRDEDWSPSYAGSTSRIDFFIPDYRLAVELKLAGSTLKAKELGEQIMVDRDRYGSHAGVSHLVCLVFDYEGRIDNPREIEKDLSRISGEQGLAVTVRIYDR
jgi:hypothetical protein